MVILTYLEASGVVSELSYKCLIFNSSRRSYCRSIENLPEQIDILLMESYNCDLNPRPQFRGFLIHLVSIMLFYLSTLAMWKNMSIRAK